MHASNIYKDEEQAASTTSITSAAGMESGPFVTPAGDAEDMVNTVENDLSKPSTTVEPSGVHKKSSAVGSFVDGIVESIRHPNARHCEYNQPYHITKWNQPYQHPHVVEDMIGNTSHDAVHPPHGDHNGDQQQTGKHHFLHDIMEQDRTTFHEGVHQDDHNANHRNEYRVGSSHQAHRANEIKRARAFDEEPARPLSLVEEVEKIMHLPHHAQLDGTKEAVVAAEPAWQHNKEIEEASSSARLIHAEKTGTADSDAPKASNFPIAVEI